VLSRVYPVLVSRLVGALAFGILGVLGNSAANAVVPGLVALLIDIQSIAMPVVSTVVHGPICFQQIPGVTVAAYSFNFTAVPHGQPLGYVTVWPTGENQPTVSTLNDRSGVNTANAALVPAGTQHGRRLCRERDH
jgi:hypothetical protein